MRAETAVRANLPFRPPLDVGALLAYLRARLVLGVEEIVDGTYRRTLDLEHGPAVLSLSAPDGGAHLLADLTLSDVRDADAAVATARRIANLDIDPAAVVAGLGPHPWLGPLVRMRPGLRAPGQAGGFEVVVRAVLGQQVSLTAACTHTSRLTASIGTPLPTPDGGLTHLFPTAAQLVHVREDDGETLAMPAGRRRALIGVARAVLGGLDLDGGLEPDEVERRLLRLPGIGPWTAQYVRMRALADPDAFCGTDLVLRRTAERLGGGPLDPSGREFAPWRTYAAHHLWRHAQLEVPL